MWVLSRHCRKETNSSIIGTFPFQTFFEDWHNDGVLPVLLQNLLCSNNFEFAILNKFLPTFFQPNSSIMIDISIIYQTNSLPTNLSLFILVRTFQFELSRHYLGVNSDRGTFLTPELLLTSGGTLVMRSVVVWALFILSSNILWVNSSTNHDYVGFLFPFQPPLTRSDTTQGTDDR